MLLKPNSTQNVPLLISSLQIIISFIYKCHLKQAPKLGRCDSYLQNLKTLPTDSLTD